MTTDQHAAEWLARIPSGAIEASRRRGLLAARRAHAQLAPGCTTWERYAIRAHHESGGGMVEGSGCREHDIFTTAGR
ncbi:MAG: hypothetical protein ACC726_02305 [Chloroflexota bacterium]